LAYVFKVGEESFLFVGHKSGRSSLEQIQKNIILKKDNKIFNQENSNHSKKLQHYDNPKEQISEKKPLQHVNISDLLTAHKKGDKNA